MIAGQSEDLAWNARSADLAYIFSMAIWSSAVLQAEVKRLGSAAMICEIMLWLKVCGDVAAKKRGADNWGAWCHASRSFRPGVKHTLSAMTRKDRRKTTNEIRDKGNSGERAHAFINPLTALLNFPMLFELLLWTLCRSSSTCVGALKLSLSLLTCEFECVGDNES